MTVLVPTGTATAVAPKAVTLRMNFPAFVIGLDGAKLHWLRDPPDRRRDSARLATLRFVAGLINSCLLPKPFR